MNDLWDESMATGDQCAVCEGPLESGGVLLEDDDGALRTVCHACATRHSSDSGSPASGSSEPPEQMEDEGATDEAEPPTPTRSIDSPGEALDALRAVLDDLATEQRVLDSVGALIARMANELIDWQTRANTYEDHARSLEAELTRLRTRLRSAEGLMAAEEPSSIDAAAGSHAFTSLPPEPSELAAGGQPPESPLTLEHVRQVQRYFNESPYVEKLGSVRRSLGRPAVSLIRLAGPVTRMLVTVVWEIVWYQYLVDLSTDLGPEDRVTLFAEGMELDELLPRYQEANANLDDHGRVDASELEVSLLGTETELITDMSPEQEQALEDATEEIWDRHTMPEFRWDD